MGLQVCSYALHSTVSLNLRPSNWGKHLSGLTELNELHGLHGLHGLNEVLLGLPGNLPVLAEEQTGEALEPRPGPGAWGRCARRPNSGRALPHAKTLARPHK